MVQQVGLRGIIEPVRYGLSDEVNSLFSRHYFEQVLVASKEYQDFDATDMISEIESLIESSAFRNEADVEEKVIRPVFRILGLNYDVQTNLLGKSVDYSIIDGSQFLENYTNTIMVVEAESYGKLAKKYYITKQDNSDPIAQIRNYLRGVNELLTNNGQKSLVEFGLLTDGGKWRIYSRKFTHNDREFEQNFIEFDLKQLSEATDEEQRNSLKLFCFLLNKEGITKHLHQTAIDSQNHQEAVTTQLRQQVYPALEYIATGIWRLVTDEDNLVQRTALVAHYGFTEQQLDDIEYRPELLKVIYDESLVLLLRLLFLLYIEDRRITDLSAIKKEGGILDAIRAQDLPVGQISDANMLNKNYDVDFASVCKEIDRRYNGGIFSDKLHPLLAGFNIDDTLFANAIDSLCRVQIGRNIVTVDFSSISIRELGTLYEGLLEYKFAMADENIAEMMTLGNKKKKRLNIRRGDLYLVNQNGERKSTGSYYTPDDVVRYLVKETLGQRLEKIDQTLEPKRRIDAIYGISVCDPAMGSGHFLIEAFDEFVDYAQRIIEENELDVNQEEVRARVVRSCLYGADINPIAVDIAKMVMWIRIFRADKPLEFLDANFICGDSLVGSYDETPHDAARQSTLFIRPEEYEPEMRQVLASRISHMQQMPRSTRDDIKEIEKYYQHEVLTYQKNITFLAHLRLTKYLMPEQAGFVDLYYEEIAKKLLENDNYIVKLYQNRKELNQKQKKLFDIVEQIEKEYAPVHWKARFPQIFVHGGFDVILGNPPWDVVKPNHNTFFVDYIAGYDRMETKVSKRLSEQLMNDQPRIRDAYVAYLKNIEIHNAFFRDAYIHQIVKQDSKTFSGDANLYKVFIEKAFTILKSGGSCGFVVPSGLNTDQGCTGLRKLLFSAATVRELIMFENRRGLFPAVDSRYKFDVLTYDKRPTKSTKFVAGYYWLDPRWLFGQPDNTEATELAAEKLIHERYVYPVKLSEVYSPEMNALVEARSKKDVPILEKIAEQPLLGDGSQAWYATSYREFDMTLDAKLFNTHGIGYPLMEGKTIHHFDAEFATPTRHVDSSAGEQRLAKKWRIEPTELPSRQYRIAYRSIARSNDTRTVIATVLPPYVFTGNSLNVLRLEGIEITASFVAGVMTVLTSFVLDYVIRQRVSTNINAFYIRELPFIRDEKTIDELGELALPLFTGRDFREFRGGVDELTDEKARMERRAELDARVARAYNLSYEQLQHILSRFPLVDVEIKAEILRAYRALG